MNKVKILSVILILALVIALITISLNLVDNYKGYNFCESKGYNAYDTKKEINGIEFVRCCSRGVFEISDSDFILKEDCGIFER